jgi:outer membrane lipoprotein-sorting protein
MCTLPRSALIGLVLLGLVPIAASAETVPLPRPAPFPKTGSFEPPMPIPTPAPATESAVPNRAAAQRQNGPREQASAGQAAPTPVVPVGKPPAMAIAGPGGTLSLDANQRGLIERANAYLTSAQTVVGDFVQVAPDGNRSQGKFYLQKPGRIRFEYDPPNTVELIADGESVAVRDRKLLTQELYPLSQTPLRFLLADRVDLLKDTEIIGVYADDLFVSLLIEERQVFGGTHRLMLMFGAQDFRLRQWTITDPQGYDTTVAIYNLDVNNKRQLNPELFKINFQRMLP